MPGLGSTCSFACPLARSGARVPVWVLVCWPIGCPRACPLARVQVWEPGLFAACPFIGTFAQLGTRVIGLALSS